ncbi:MAG: DsbC family protein [Nitrosomonadaceae bacterium]
MHIKLFLLSLLLYLLSSTVHADEASLKKSLEAYFPNEKIEILKKTPFLELYEVVVGDQLFYVDEKANYFFAGYIFDIKMEKNITEERLREIKDARRVDINSLPLGLAIKEVKGSGKRKMVIFSDPNCGYCKRLEKELVNVTDVTIYTLLYPILNGSKEVAKTIWCSDDRLKAWNDFMLNAIKPTGTNCKTPIDTLLQLGKKHGFNSTPTMIFADGKVVVGIISAEIIEKKLNELTN